MWNVVHFFEESSPTLTATAVCSTESAFALARFPTFTCAPYFGTPSSITACYEAIKTRDRRCHSRKNDLTDITIMTEKVRFALTVVIFAFAVVTTRQVLSTYPKNTTPPASHMAIVSYLHFSVLTERRTISLLPEG